MRGHVKFLQGDGLNKQATGCGAQSRTFKFLESGVDAGGSEREGTTKAGGWIKRGEGQHSERRQKTVQASKACMAKQGCVCMKIWKSSRG